MFLYLIQLFTWLAANVIGRVFLGMRVSGLRNIKNINAGNVIFAANHEGSLDPFLIGGALPRSYYRKNKALRFMTYFKFYDGRWYKPYMKAVGAFPVYPGQGDIEKSTKSTIELLGRGEDLIIFPTAKRMERLNPEDARRGVAVIAEKMKSLIVPVYIHDTHIIKWMDFLLFRRHVKIVFGQAFRLPENNFGAVDHKKIAEDIMRKVEELEISERKEYKTFLKV